MMFFNGLIIQNKNNKNQVMEFVPNVYCGIQSLSEVYFSEKQGERAHMLQREITFDVNSGNPNICNEFITSADLAKKYILMCQSLEIAIRILFIESYYPFEIWKDNKPKCDFLGYELIEEVPTGIMTLYDLYTNEKLSRYRDLLNENGLFKSEEDATEFMRHYKELLVQGLVGDGNVDLYVCRVSEVKTEDLLHLN